LKKPAPKSLAQEELDRGGGEVALKPPKPRISTKSEQYLDACTLAAGYRGISIEQLFKQEPERYEQYRRLVLEE